MLSVKECASRAGVCESVVRGWVASGMLAHYRLGRPGARGKIVITAADLDALLATFRVERKEPGPVPTPAPSAFRHLRLS